MNFDHNTIILGVIVTMVFIIALFLKNRTNNASAKAAVPYTKKTDPDAQAKYDEKTSPKNPLSQDEKTELSWHFLYNITEVVLNNFSKEDREAVHSIGHNLLDNGTGYEHVVEYGLTKEKKKSRLSEENEKDSKS